ncbi:hypothetical protein DTO027B5_5086 [Paecilomyces variotii]|nr:hypothetical protein DTO169C6_5571 [Paecilomyces variotii]KAJ9284378.1 hypothetical protein DTO021C3_8023 [Paecilomyces variotii]KAJ9322595.1 hypothetical protein DTO027B3_6365 [Paecilomyces variotii]KAJ9333178.1 hypothetical protein DTO027B5_5086 [Paecilomyces variotii]KAJ9396120.1 hypothetical protein DTO282F9_6963 [Paecilomyces variotii]
MNLDSQDPRVILSVGETKGFPSPQFVFTLEKCHITMAMEKESDGLFQTIQDLRKQNPSWFQGFEKVTLWVIKKTAGEDPVETGFSWKLGQEAQEKWCTLRDRIRQSSYVFIWKNWAKNYKDPERIQSWFNILQSKIANAETGGIFWAYKIAQQLQPADGSDERHVELPWLKSEDGQYAKWAPSEPYFCSETERKWRLVEGSRIEREIQHRAITTLFSTANRHKFWIERLPELKHCFVHVKVQNTSDDEQMPVPEIRPPTKVEFTLVENENIAEITPAYLSSGLVVHRQTTADFVLLVPFLPEREYKGHSIVVVIKPDLEATDRQIRALREAGNIQVHGDAEPRQGYSLQKTIMARGVELNPDGPDYFELSVNQISNVEPSLQEERLAYILQKFPLDETQREAFNRSISRICAGIHLIQGPPGTGKTHTAVVVVLAFACLNVRVMIAAGSNKGVDNLAAAVTKALRKDVKLLGWCGQLVRFRSPATQLSVLRAKSASPAIVKRQSDKLGQDEVDLQDVQMESLVLKEAQANDGSDASSTSVRFLQLLGYDQEHGLTQERTKELKNCLEQLSRPKLEKAKIVATTLNNASQDILRLPGIFEPQVLVCDESGQCLEGDHMIAMTMPSIRVLILLGDPEQLPPTVLSENATNESALFLKRSLMERLYKAGYPCTTLTTNYRSHPQILDLYNRQVYHGKLQAALTNSASDPVGDAWDEFTRSHHHFREMGVAGVRRLFISTSGLAEHSGNSQSWCNIFQAEVVRDLLKALYDFQPSRGDKIQAEDVMVISPYKDQKHLMDRVFDDAGLECRDNLTVDASQGSEAKIVIYLMTKPSDCEGHKTGFLVDKQRMNVALSRAKKVQIIIGNLEVWNTQAIERLKRRYKNDFLVKLLEDVSAKGHTVTWCGPSTVTELEPPLGFRGYPMHDRDRRKPDNGRGRVSSSRRLNRHRPPRSPSPPPPPSTTASSERPRVSLPRREAYSHREQSRRPVASTRSPSPSGTVDYDSRARSPRRSRDAYRDRPRSRSPPPYHYSSYSRVSERDIPRQPQTAREARRLLFESQQRREMAIVRLEDRTTEFLVDELRFLEQEESRGRSSRSGDRDGSERRR